ncbi:hypothetical protein RND59_18215 [Vibrio ruber]|uniref:Uncharacterized protein n=1 Tax=Vibrio rhizosphaerae TaxID=398736 RepID=A0ABU4IYW0_9VIBR|nr:MULTISPECIES: hypothetical protein [Vibrio]MDW6094454.1 hypothetical protein [Vibrio rhizosphaerae]WNJ97144.1 hypothetical protein RND59_18215 [Vibrio ruber]
MKINKIKELEYISDMADLAVLALSSILLADYKGVSALQKGIIEISRKAEQLIEQETCMEQEI